MMLFFASTSQAATRTPPAAPVGMTQVRTSSMASGAIGVSTATVRPMSTAPPRAMSV